MANTSRTSLEQGRAAYAYTSVVAGAKIDKDSEYKSYLQKLPMYIKTNGLGAAMAFAFAKGSKNGVAIKEKAWGLIYAQIEDWLKNHWELIELHPDERLMENLLNMESSTYRATTIEVLALLNWMRRFAEGLITK